MNIDKLVILEDEQLHAVVNYATASEVEEKEVVERIQKEREDCIVEYSSRKWMAFWDIFEQVFRVRKKGSPRQKRFAEVTRQWYPIDVVQKKQTF